MNVQDDLQKLSNRVESLFNKIFESDNNGKKLLHISTQDLL